MNATKRYPSFFNKKKTNILFYTKCKTKNKEESNDTNKYIGMHFNVMNVFSFCFVDLDVFLYNSKVVLSPCFYCLVLNVD